MIGALPHVIHTMCVQVAEDSEKDPEATFADYCDEVEKSAAWGGQLELQALAGAYERHITVYSVGMPPVEMGKEFEGVRRSLVASQAFTARCDEQLLQLARACERHITVSTLWECLLWRWARTLKVHEGSLLAFQALMIPTHHVRMLLL